MSSKKSAEASADTNRVNQATRDLHNAEDVAKAVDARAKYYEAYRAYLKVEADDPTAGELVVVLRDAQAGVSWKLWPIHAE